MIRFLKKSETTPSAALELEAVFYISLKKGDKVTVLTLEGELVEGTVMSLVQPKFSLYSNIEREGTVYVRMPYKDREEVFSFSSRHIYKRK